ncbi:putative secreted protein [Synechococcus sp. BIOS-E4-1]|uniref:hypothetical protein n=1 Tax=Synechococcus sp. BIOS-E4-1 TaxID=1400864 RepID=UPI0016471571|nr:hypothetical protein [Synechococcus sp. BIOS-E4-1]QNI53988.1 putative secreted protein [Synechococcus sp. BIOS-E4-1]
MKRIAAVTAAAALLGTTPALADIPALLGEVTPPELKPAPPPLTFDRSLESLERNGVITPRQRRQLDTEEQARPIDVPAFKQACRTGALTQLECSSGVAVRRRSSRLQPRVIADSDDYSPQQLFSTLPNVTSVIWVELAADSDLNVIARELDLSLKELSELNERPAGALLREGSWVVLPEASRGDVADSSRFVPGSLRTTAPLSSPPPRKDVVEIKAAQSLSSFVRDHGITLQQLKDYNPGVPLSRMLVAGSMVRVARAPVLGIRPLRSGGASWPDLPGFSGSSSGSTMPVGTTYTAPDSAEKRRIREQIQQRRRAEEIAAARRAEAERLAADRRAEAARIARLKSEEERRKRYRLLGNCTYDWKSWGKSPSGVRSVKASGCSGITEVAVDCSNTKISKLRWSKWRAWEVPGTGFEDLVVESCANVLGATKPTYTDPLQSGTGRVIEASTTQPVQPSRTTTPPIPAATVIPEGGTNSMPSDTVKPCIGSRIQCATGKLNSSDSLVQGSGYSNFTTKPRSKCGGNLVCNVLDVFF